MTKNEYIALRIEELEARRTYAAQLVMNRDMAHEVKMCDLQIKALMNERELQTVNVDEFCAHRWNVPNGGMIQDGDKLECEKCGAVKIPPSRLLDDKGA